MSNNVLFSYAPAVLRETSKSWYIEFSWIDSLHDKHRERRYINAAIKRFKNLREKRLYAQRLVDEYNRKLSNGWTPETDSAITTGGRLAGTPMKDVEESYRLSIQQMLNADLIRIHTKNSYNSYINLFSEWNGKYNSQKIVYIYQLDTEQCRAFLDWTISFRHVSLSTRDYYKAWLKTFCNWLIDVGYLQKNPAEVIKSIVSRKRKNEKSRQAIGKYYIKPTDRLRIFQYVDSHNKHFLLVCYLLYYCFVRPKEISMLQIKHIHLHDQLLFIPADVSKNRKDDYVTLPKVVCQLMLDLNLFSFPSDFYIFGPDMLPNYKYHKAEQFRDAWMAVRRALSLTPTLKLYNLKHTGITDMTDVMPEKIVQHQARHYSVTMTERYIQKKLAEAAKEITDYE